MLQKGSGQKFFWEEIYKNKKTLEAFQGFKSVLL